MNKLQKQQLAFLEEMVAYYSADTTRRAVDALSSCEYFSENGNRCAIGRKMFKSRYHPKMEGSSVLSLIEHYGATILPKKVLILGADFLADIQELHDSTSSSYWNEKIGLTKEGKLQVKFIKKCYGLNNS